MRNFERTVFFLLLALLLSNTLIAQNSDVASKSQKPTTVIVYVEKKQKEIEPTELLPETREKIDDDLTEFVIRSNVPNAAVYLNSIYQGKTPLTIKNYTQGAYELIVNGIGYEIPYYFINITKGQRQKYYVSLEKAFGFISVEGAPENSSYYIDGQKQTALPAEVPAGSHTVTIKNTGYSDINIPITVEADSHYTLRVSMKKNKTDG